jgi:hypothetical protein
MSSSPKGSSDFLGNPIDEAATHTLEDPKGRMIAGPRQDGQQTDVASTLFTRRINAPGCVRLVFRHPAPFIFVP